VREAAAKTSISTKGFGRQRGVSANRASIVHNIGGSMRVIWPRGLVRYGLMSVPLSPATIPLESAPGRLTQHDRAA
jgi:hypothetical protein